MQDLVIFWCRRDFRLTDNRALWEAANFAKSNRLQFLPIFVLDDAILKTMNLAPIRLKFLQELLSSFSRNFERFAILNATPEQAFTILKQQFANLYIFAGSDVEFYSIQRDTSVANLFSKKPSLDISAQKSLPGLYLFSDQLSVDSQVFSQSGNLYTVFTPFKKAVWQQFIAAEVYPKADLNGLDYFKGSLPIKDLSFDEIEQKLKPSFDLYLPTHQDLPENELPFGIKKAAKRNKTFYVINVENILKPQLSGDFLDHFSSQENDVLKQFDDFLTSKKIEVYKENRNDLGLDTLDDGQTSKMSYALKWGLVSARYLKQQVLQHFGGEENLNQGGEAFLSELLWREFYRYILYHNPWVLDLEFQPRFKRLKKANFTHSQITDLKNAFSVENLNKIV